MPFQIGGNEIAVGASIGIAATSRADDTADVLLRNADVAMYTAKAAGKRRAAVFEPTMHAALVARHSLSAELSRSLGRGELAVFFQPIVRLADGQMVGVEALVRWRHPTRGLILPGEFIALAEETGLILALGRWVLAEAAMRFGAWQAQPGVADDFFVSVNISPLQLQQPEFIDEIESILDATGLDPRRLVLELTETAMFQDTEATIVKLGALRARGVRIALDDFGTGYSSLGYLRRFPVDILKIARDFVVQPDLEQSEWAFAHAIVALGQTLGLHIIAEGIEEAAQVERLLQLGCEFGQGFHLGLPIDASQPGALRLADPASSVKPAGSRAVRRLKAVS